MTSTVDAVKSAIDIVDVVGAHVDLKQAGNHYTGFCPFHHNTRTPAFVVFPETQTWRCFGACAEGGDVFSFVEKKNGWDFAEALKELADRAGVEIGRRNHQVEQKKNRYQTLLEAAGQYYHDLLLSHNIAGYARSYLRKRELDGDAVREFQLGFAPDEWTALRDHMESLGFSQDELLDVGLLSKHEESGRVYDRFRNRVMFPINDKRGRLVGLGGRTLHPDGIPKYMNTPDSIVFTKGDHLYGLDKVPHDAESVVVVEGYMDVIQGWMKGRRNMVAQMGTALTPHQMKLLRSAKRSHICVATDGDEAGRKSAMRNAPQLLAHAQKVGLDVRIVPIPQGLDPDDLLRKDVGEWDRLTETAVPVVAYVIQILTADLARDDVRQKVDVSEQIAPLIATLASSVEQAHYRQMLADALAVGAGDIPLATPVIPREPKQVAAVVNPAEIGNQAQARFLRQCLGIPGALQMVNQVLQQVGQPPVKPIEFEHPSDRVVVSRLNHPGATFDEVIERVDLLKTLPLVSPDSRYQVNWNLALSVVRWRQISTRQEMSEAQLLMSQTGGDFQPDGVNEWPVRLAQLGQSVSQLQVELAA